MDDLGRNPMKKLRGLLRRGTGATQPAQPTVHVACFGKHPGWDDHMDHLGFDTAHLIQVWQSLYQDGVRANLDRGSWEKELTADRRLPGFDHAFLWWTDETIDLGSMWASRDNKGRSDYPMIACLSAERAGLDWVCAEGSKVIQDLQRECEASQGSEGVIDAVGSAQAGLREALQGSIASISEEDAAGAIERIAELPPFAEDPEQFVRFVYHIERECGLGIVHGRASSAMKLAPNAQHLRVPALVERTIDSLRLWVLAVRALAPERSIFVCRAQGRDWVDITVGTPGTDEVFALLATTTAIPVVTAIPYDIEEQDRSRILAMAGRTLG